MKKDFVETLIERLNAILDDGKAQSSSGGPYIHKDMDVEQLTQSEKLMVHVLLHKFYASGHRDLSKEDIEQLHDKVIEGISHKVFDKLDKK